MRKFKTHDEDFEGKDLQVGDSVPYWISGMPDGLCTVLEIKPYDGLFTQFFNYFIRLSAANTDRGWAWTCCK